MAEPRGTTHLTILRHSDRTFALNLGVILDAYDPSPCFIELIQVLVQLRGGRLQFFISTLSNFLLNSWLAHGFAKSFFSFAFVLGALYNLLHFLLDFWGSQGRAYDAFILKLDTQRVL